MPFFKPNFLYYCGKSSKYFNVLKNPVRSNDFVQGYSSKSTKSTTQVPVGLLQNQKPLTGLKPIKESVSKNYENVTKSTIEKIFNNNLFLLYREYTGQEKTEMAKTKVTEAKDKFIKIQQDRRRVQKELSDVQIRLKAASEKLKKIDRVEKEYLEVVTAEHEMFVKEAELMKELKEADELERSNFSLLGDAISQSHQAQNEKDEKMKNVNLFTTVGSLLVGTLSLMYYYKRCKELHSTVQSFSENHKNMETIISQLTNSMNTQNSKIEEFLKDLKTGIGNYPAIESMLNKNSNSQTKSVNQSGIVQSAIQKQEQILHDIKDMKLMLGLVKSKDNETNVVYVGKDMENILKKTENNIEWKMKMNALATVAFVYGALALTIPVFISIFSGGK